ncbi:MAG TPA: nucleotidyltransferase domain-containing protein [Thermoanaerobaculia bacterium]|nr:nucleotidyltransferase domain-containing protein [Thermoanaerobaculia bacterium]
MNALPPLIAERLPEVRALCARHGVKNLAIFGSAVKGTFDSEKSDLDFVVEFLPGTPVGGLRGPYFQLLEGLQDLFGRRVDLVERRAIENPYFIEVLALTQQPVYGSPAAA